jgi:aminopeptidase N
MTAQAVTIEDFIKCFEDAASAARDLTQFSLWYHQAGARPHISHPQPT